MKRPWRLILEVGNPDSPAAISAPSTIQSDSSAPCPECPSLDSMWPTLVDARRKLVDAMSNGTEAKVNEVNQWLGGALAATAVLTGNSAEALLDRVKAEVPAPERPNPLEGVAEIVHVERERPKPHPGAQRPIDPSELSAEERAELGIVLPGEGLPDDE